MTAVTAVGQLLAASPTPTPISAVTDATNPQLATGVFDLLWVLVAIPLAGAAILLLAGRRADRWGHLLGCATVLGDFVIGCVMFAYNPVEGSYPLSCRSVPSARMIGIEMMPASGRVR